MYAYRLHRILNPILGKILTPTIRVAAVLLLACAVSCGLQTTAGEPQVSGGVSKWSRHGNWLILQYLCKDLESRPHRETRVSIDTRHQMTIWVCSDKRSQLDWVAQADIGDKTVVEQTNFEIDSAGHGYEVWKKNKLRVKYNLSAVGVGKSVVTLRYGPDARWSVELTVTVEPRPWEADTPTASGDEEEPPRDLDLAEEDREDPDDLTDRRVEIAAEASRWSMSGDEIQIDLPCPEFGVPPHQKGRVDLEAGGELTVAACTESGGADRWSIQAKIDDEMILKQTGYEAAPSSRTDRQTTSWSFAPGDEGQTVVWLQYGTDAKRTIDLIVNVVPGVAAEVPDAQPPRPSLDRFKKKGTLLVRHADQILVPWDGGLTTSDFYIGQEVYFEANQTVDSEFLESEVGRSNGEPWYGKSGITFDPADPAIAGMTFSVRAIEPFIQFDEPFPEDMRNDWDSYFQFEVRIEVRDEQE